MRGRCLVNNVAEDQFPGRALRIRECSIVHVKCQQLVHVKCQQLVKPLGKVYWQGLM